MVTPLNDNQAEVGGGGIRAALGRMLRASAMYLAELVSRIVGGLKDLGAAALMAGAMSATVLSNAACQDGAKRAEAASTPPIMTAVSVMSPTDRARSFDAGPKQLGTFNLTFYYVISEDEVARQGSPKVVIANDNAVVVDEDSADGVEDPAESAAAVAADTELAAMAMVPADVVPLYGATCESIADVAPEFASQLRIQGTGKLRDGRVVTIWGECSCPRSPCYQVTSQQWGRSGTGKPLQPYRTVAVDPKVVKLGSLLWIPALEGRTMPGRAPWGGFVHDGCVVADDTGGSIKNKQLDLFVGHKAWFHGLAQPGTGGSHYWSRAIQVFDGTGICEQRNRKVARKTGGV